MIQEQGFQSSLSGGNAMGQLTDIAAEGEALDKIIAGLDASQWALQTPAPG
jgi:hypothetical protein